MRTDNMIRGVTLLAAFVVASIALVIFAASQPASRHAFEPVAGIFDQDNPTKPRPTTTAVPGTPAPADTEAPAPPDSLFGLPVPPDDSNPLSEIPTLALGDEWAVAIDGTPVPPSLRLFSAPGSLPPRPSPPRPPTTTPPPPVTQPPPPVTEPPPPVTEPPPPVTEPPPLLEPPELPALPDVPFL